MSLSNADIERESFSQLNCTHRMKGPHFKNRHLRRSPRVLLHETYSMGPFEGTSPRKKTARTDCVSLQVKSQSRNCVVLPPPELWKQNKMRELNSVLTEHWFYLQPAQSPFDISYSYCSDVQPIRRMMKARAVLWPLNPSAPRISLLYDCGILGYCYILIYPILSSALPCSQPLKISSSVLYVPVPLVRYSLHRTAAYTNTFLLFSNISSIFSCPLFGVCILLYFMFFALHTNCFSSVLHRAPTPCFASSRSVPCPPPCAHRSHVRGSGMGSKDEGTKAPKTALKSQSVNQHTSSSHNTWSHTHTHVHLHTHTYTRIDNVFISSEDLHP